MKLYTRDDFLKLPEGTLFCPGDLNWNFESICVKADAHAGMREGVFMYLRLNWIEVEEGVDAFSSAIKRFEDMLKDGGSYPLNECWDYDKPWDGQEGYYLVFQVSDLERLRSYVEAALRIFGK